MGDQTFRSQWVVRWLVAFGGACLLAAVAVAAFAITAESTTGPSDAELRHSAELCQARINSGDDPQSAPCRDVTGSGLDQRTELAALAGVLALLGVTQLVGAARVGIDVSDAGVTVRNPLRTHRSLWSDISGFRIEGGQAGRLAYAFGRIDLVDGRSHRIEALCAMPWETRRGLRAEQVIDELNGELTRQRARLDWEQRARQRSQAPQTPPPGPPRPTFGAP